MARIAIGILSFVLLLGLGAAFAADESSAKEQSSAKKPAKSAAGKPSPTKAPRAKPAPSLSAAQRDAAALAFAREHHAELAKLIEKLRIENRGEYDRAMRQLWQTRERLMRLRKVSPPQYEVALAAWKLDSRAQLLAARMTMSQDPALEAELKKVLFERAGVRQTELKLEQQRLRDRLAKVESLLEELEKDRSAVAAKELARMKQSVARTRRAANRKGPVAAKPSDFAKPTVVHSGDLDEPIGKSPEKNARRLATETSSSAAVRPGDLSGSSTQKRQ